MLLTLRRPGRRWVQSLLVAGIMTTTTCSVLAGDQETVPIPDVRGMTIEAGAARLQSLGLCIWVDQGSGIDRGPRIVAQRPQVGVVVAKGTAVSIVTTTVEDISDILSRIGRQNAELSCTEGTGVGDDGGTATSGST